VSSPNGVWVETDKPFGAYLNEKAALLAIDFVNFPYTKVAIWVLIQSIRFTVTLFSNEGVASSTRAATRRLCLKSGTACPTFETGTDLAVPQTYVPTPVILSEDINDMLTCNCSRINRHRCCN